MRFQGAVAARAVRWSTLSVLGRQGSQVLFAVVVARLIGPQQYGAISAATVFATLAALLLDQGVSSALVQRRDLNPRVPGASATVSLALGVLLGVLTWLTAPSIAAFFGSPVLSDILRWLGAGLVIKALAIAPRAMLLRGLRLRAVAAADIAGALAGAASGITAAAYGFGAQALIPFVLVGDCITAIVLLSANRGPVPNGHLATFVPMVRFGSKVFATNALAYLSRNTDNVLVGRFLGTTALSYYSMGYRILVIPVQFIGQSVNRVMYPVFSRAADDREQLAAYLSTSTQVLAVGTLPMMALFASAAPQLVGLVLGSRWLPAAPLMTILAIAGARETLFYITPALVRATGRAGLNLRFELLSTAVQLSGIVAGLRFGLLGVAIGYTAAGVVMTPIAMALQRRITGVGLLEQARSFLPPLHASLWGAAAYAAVAWTTRGLGDAAVLLAGAVAFALVVLFVLGALHRAYLDVNLVRIARVLGRRMGSAKVAVA